MEGDFFTADGSFHQYFNKLKIGIQPEQWKKFSKLSTPEEHIKFCLDVSGIHDVKVSAHKSIKDLEKAMEFKVFITYCLSLGFG